jgi:hypothetical protein
MDRNDPQTTLDALYGALSAADEAQDAEALAALAWQLYGELGSTRSDLNAARASLTQVRQLAAVT